MGIFRSILQVKPNTTGYLYINNRFIGVKQPGRYSIWWKNKNRLNLICLPVTSKQFMVVNQEVLSKDNIAFRFSFNMIYRITDGMKFLTKFTLDRPVAQVIADAEQRLGSLGQFCLKKKIAETESEILNEQRGIFADFRTEELENEAAELGIVIEQAQLRDPTFPKIIQDLFAKHLEAKVRSKTELENARTAVATARALKNASELMKGDENLKFFQVLETITKIAEKGKHTFAIGDINQLVKK